MVMRCTAPDAFCAASITLATTRSLACRLSMLSRKLGDLGRETPRAILLSGDALPRTAL